MQSCVVGERHYDGVLHVHDNHLFSCAYSAGTLGVARLDRTLGSLDLKRITLHGEGRVTCVSFYEDKMFVVVPSATHGYASGKLYRVDLPSLVKGKVIYLFIFIWIPGFYDVYVNRWVKTRKEKIVTKSIQIVSPLYIYHQNIIDFIFCAVIVIRLDSPEIFQFNFSQNSTSYALSGTRSFRRAFWSR